MSPGVGQRWAENEVCNAMAPVGERGRPERRWCRQAGRRADLACAHSTHAPDAADVTAVCAPLVLVAWVRTRLGAMQEQHLNDAHMAMCCSVQQAAAPTGADVRTAVGSHSRRGVCARCCRLWRLR